MPAFTGLAALAASLAVALSPGIAVAVDQTPKNGCGSSVTYSGQLTSPAFTSSSPSTRAQVTFQGWFEGESVDPSDGDLATVL